MVLLFLTVSYAYCTEAPKAASTDKKVKVVDTQKLQFIIKTNKGVIKGDLYPDVAPNTVLNFVTLAKKGFYNGLNFHRVVPGFVIQGGDPKGNGSGGPGYCIPAEFNSKPHKLGTLAMARAMDPDSAGSQFYICIADGPQVSNLDKNYTVFGQVTKGMPIALTIAVGDKIKSIEIIGDLPKKLQGKEVKKSNVKK
jgi:peptidyl-prolyl cis-trans isomerase B (cyclophilin B)